MIWRSGERGSGISVLAARHDFIYHFGFGGVLKRSQRSREILSLFYSGPKKDHGLHFERSHRIVIFKDRGIDHCSFSHCSFGCLVVGCYVSEAKIAWQSPSSPGQQLI